MKRTAAMFLTGILVFALAFSAGCTYDPYEYEAEDGFFVYKKQKGEDAVVIVGLTELGNQQEVIVMPKTIGGYKYNFTFNKGRGYGINRFEPLVWEANNKLKRIYFEYDLFGNTWWAGSSSGSISVDTFKNLRVLEKVIINNRSALSGRYSNIAIYGNKYFIYNKKNIYDEYQNFKYFNELADIHYIYNFDNAPNNSCYWIDDIDDGEKIEIIPPDPEREGYTFAGWYCEPECENEWDFNNKIIKKDIEQGDFYPDDYVTYIYAKWDKK